MNKAWPILVSLALGARLFAQTPAVAPTSDSLLLTVEGVVELYPLGGTGWSTAQTNEVLHMGDRLRTSERSRATIRLSDLTVLRLNELTTLQLRPPATPGVSSLLDVKSGSAYFLGREKPARQEFRTPLTSGAIRGTEFNLAVADDGRTVVTLIDGEVGLSNQLGQVAMVSGEQGIVETGKAPVKTPMLEAINIIQWCLYYPGVLDADELALGAEEQQALSTSMDAYRSGDLLASVAQYPVNRARGSPKDRVYRAATLLSAGQVDQAELLLAELQRTESQDSRASRLAAALREVIAVVKNQAVPQIVQPQLATEWLVESYYLQGHARLGEALCAARAAVEKSPNFGYGWARVAELELSLGRLPQALTALDKSLQLSPRNAQSLAVKGFIELAQGREKLAVASFDQAIAVDGALGNGWLGRGLCEIRRGDAEAGRKDIQVAAVLEPQRAVLRSYLGKAFSNTGDNRRAKKELTLAERLDANDPTAWLYRALVEQQDNAINTAVRDLEKSEKLNDNRRLFRSRLLLDEDQAVRSANLARIYQDTGFYNWNKDVAASDWGVREASRAVNYDYANYSAHQFLADNYDALRDPSQINLRYETPWFGELIVASLLSPVAAGNLSEFSAQRQASALFEQSHFGVISDTEFLSRGDWLERGSQYGTYDDVAYAVDSDYRSQNGWRNNNGLEQLTTSAKAKVQLTPHDSLFLEGIYYDSSFGDVLQYYNQYGHVPSAPPVPSSQFRGSEREQPNVFLGYHHEWAPGSHTLFLGGYLTDHLHYNDPQAQGLFAANRFGSLFVTNYNFPLTYDRHFEAYSAELQQILQTERQTLVVGARYQKGWTTYSSSQVDNSGLNNGVIPTFATNANNNLERYSFYGYETVKMFDRLQLTAGIAYDHLGFPRNDDAAPISGAETAEDQFSPKAGLIWTLTPETFFRFAYTRSLGGLSYDNSIRLEPTQVAGFNQAFRSLVPESVAGAPGARFTTYGVGLDRSFKSNTYLSLDGQILDSEASPDLGAVSGNFFGIPSGINNVSESLGYTEQTLAVSLSQLLGDRWSLGGRYQLSHAELRSQLVALLPQQDQSARLQQMVLYVNYAHPCGFFGQAQSIWTAQQNHGYAPALSGADFWQFNAYAGYRFLHRAAEVKVGLLNITAQDYLLNPLNLYYDLPRARTLAVSFKFFF